MGTWETGPFGNDTAADFANALDDAEPEVREALIRGVLVRMIDATGYLMEAEEAVAAAALIAAQCPEGDPVDTPHGPETPMPLFPSDLRALADEALARIVGDEDGQVSRCPRSRGSFTTGMNPSIKRAVLAVPETAWQQITYPTAVPGPETGEFKSWPWETRSCL
ncbi:DUF4259 domain-containing protein [Streptomyces sp. NPDC056930]|uniref:DUF4259 domain-containing protein n=1 Tax=Streptomyces sp. NPDC056930 TaxID=3345967 RepID=UPI0036279A49